MHRTACGNTASAQDDGKRHEIGGSVRECGEDWERWNAARNSAETVDAGYRNPTRTLGRHQ
jgi:hypothetical protein